MSWDSRLSLAKAMLLVTKDVRSVKVLHEMAVDYVLYGIGAD